jgi:hypothetical protein
MNKRTFTKDEVYELITKFEAECIDYLRLSSGSCIETWVVPFENSFWQFLLERQGDDGMVSGAQAKEVKKVSKTVVIEEWVEIE